jgi:NDP-sugar pyrophosphorylase family protein
VILLNAFDHMAAEEKITGFKFEDPWNEIATVWHVGAFVDDTN